MITPLHDLLKFAVNAGASDVTIKADAPATLKINDKMQHTDFAPSAEMMSRFISQVVSPSQMKQLEATGDVDLSFNEEDAGRFRANIHRQRGAIAANLRWVKNTIFSFEQLNLPPILAELIARPRGIILVTGSTGCGKSTTMAAMLEHLNSTTAKHIVTIEDPIEYEFTDRESFFEQREVGRDTVSFVSAMVHALRQNPDVIMIGEMRDRESFDVTLQASNTGHLVLSTMHSTNAYRAINRIMNYYDKIEQEVLRESLSENLVAIISQRLIPHRNGSRMIPAFEIMINSAIISKLIIENRFEKLEDAIAANRFEGMCTFNQSLLELTQNGLIDVNEALENSDNPSILRMNFKGIFLAGGDNKIIGN